MDEANPRAESVAVNTTTVLIPVVVDVHNHPGLSDVCERRSVRSGEQLTGVPQVMDVSMTITIDFIHGSFYANLRPLEVHIAPG